MNTKLNKRHALVASVFLLVVTALGACLLNSFRKGKPPVLTVTSLSIGSDGVVAFAFDLDNLSSSADEVHFTYNMDGARLTSWTASCAVFNEIVPVVRPRASKLGCVILLGISDGDGVSYSPSRYPSLRDPEFLSKVALEQGDQFNLRTDLPKIIYSSATPEGVLFEIEMRFSDSREPLSTSDQNSS